MELLRNVEMGLMLSFGLLCAGACLVEPAPRGPRATVVQAAAAAPMQVVVISARRMTRAEKQADAAGIKRAG